MAVPYLPGRRVQKFKQTCVGQHPGQQGYRPLDAVTVACHRAGRVHMTKFNIPALSATVRTARANAATTARKFALEAQPSCSPAERKASSSPPAPENDTTTTPTV